MAAIFTGEEILGDEDLRRVPEPPRGERDGDAVVAAGRGRDAGARHGAGHEVVERAARLERARVLEQLELEGERGFAEGARVRREERCAPDVGRDEVVGREDVGGSDGEGHPPTLAH